MLTRRLWPVLATALALAVLPLSPAAAQTCTGNCGNLGADGVVTAPPSGAAQYGWVSTDDGVTGVALPGVGGIDGSMYQSSVFSAAADDELNYWFNYVTSDGSTFADYAWARLLNAGDMSEAALLFTARTKPEGSIVPGQDLPAPTAGVTLSPASVEIIDGGTSWSPLGSDSGLCYLGSGQGCGYTDWVFSSFLIPTAGSYLLEFGVTNWTDNLYDSGLAFDGLTVAGEPIDPGIGVIPEPMSMLLLATGLLGVGVVARRRRRGEAEV